MRGPAALVGALACTALAVVCAANTATSPDKKSAIAGCGGGRARVKTLSDSRAHLVSNRPRETSIAALRRLPVPGGLTRKSPRRPGAERTNYRVRGRLVEMTLEADGDILLVVLDTRTKGKLVTEFPTDSCTRGASKQHRKLMRNARAALIAACGRPSRSTTEIGGSATITGVGFFEPGDGVPRESPNGFELHPVLGFQGSRCPVGAAPYVGRDRPLRGAEAEALSMSRSSASGARP
jgi:hypothetical protein